MIELENVTIIPITLDSISINWEIKSTSEDIEDYGLLIRRSETSADISEFDLIYSGVEAFLGTYLDNNLERMTYSNNRNIYYYLTAENLNTGLTSDYGPYYITTTPDYVTQEIIRRKNIVLNNSRYKARTFYLLKRKTWGTYCTRCFDQTIQKPRDPECSVCYGTGITGGYFIPQAIKGFRSDKPNQKIINIFGVWEDTNVYFNLANYPHVKPGDYLVDEQNTRYLILSPVKHVEKGMYIISQEIQAKIISKSDSVYLYNMEEYLL